jgi:hypothetical protein
MHFNYILTLTLNADVNKPQTNGKYAFTFEHIPYHNYPTNTYVSFTQAEVI